MPIFYEEINSSIGDQSISDWVRKATINIAEQALMDEVRRGFDNSPVVVTDGMPRRDYNLVKPFGVIEFIANTQVAEAVRWALTELQKRSPVLTGRYAQSHTVLLNGQEMQGNMWQALRNLGPDDRVQIVNPQPYARKIERSNARKKTGREKRKALSKQARAGVYQPVVKALVSRYGKSMFFDFKYVKLNTGLKVWGKQGGGANAKRVQRDQVYPAIQFFKKSVGLPN